MNIFLLGATGRVGTELLRLALPAGHRVTALVRSPKKLEVRGEGLTLETGDVYQGDSLRRAFLSSRWDAVVNVVGSDPLKPSTLVTDAARALAALSAETNTPRYVAITGTAEMPKTWGGRIGTLILKLTPVRNAIRDHDGAFSVLQNSGLDYALVGCPWIKDGPTKGSFRTSEVFPGGKKTIHPGDVALALFQELESPSLHRAIRGIWY